MKQAVENFLFVVLTGLTLSCSLVRADDGPKDTNHSHQAEVSDGSQALASEVVELRAKVLRLEAALEKNHKGSPEKSISKKHGHHGSMGKSAHGKMKEMPMMGMKSKGGMKMGGMKMGEMMMKKKKKKSMPMMGHKRMKMMGMMRGMNMAQSSLPGFPGVSHLYHVGATDFFLNHAEQLSLSPQQKKSISQARKQFASTENTLNRRVEESEEALWKLTAEDEPSSQKIEKKIREIEKLKGDMRIEFISAVGKAASLLTDDQRQILVGIVSAQTGESELSQGGSK